MRLATSITLPEQAVPANPVTGTIVLYSKSDGRLYYKDDTGAEIGPLAGTVSAPANMVTTDTDQTITSTKTFSVSPVVPDGSFAASKLSATGTRDATTYLRGDNTWVAIATGSPTNMVTTDTAQTISGNKTFTGTNTFNGISLPHAWPITSAGQLPLYTSGSSNSEIVAGNASFTALHVRPQSSSLYSVRVNGFGGATNVPVLSINGTSGQTADLITFTHPTTNAQIGRVGPNAEMYDGLQRVYSLNNKVPVAGISATGTADGTTYLRGDGTWTAISTGAPTNMLTTDTAQTLTTAGVKTFPPGTLLMQNAAGTQTAEPYSDINAPASLEMTVATTPTTPAAGRAALFTTDGKSLALRHNDGTTTTIGSGGGGGSWASQAKFGVD